MFNKIISLLTYDLWHIQINRMSYLKASTIKILRIAVLSARSFNSDKCYLRASALTFYSLLSIVPTLAMLFGIARGFDLDNKLKKSIYDNFEPHNEIVGEIINFSESMLSNTKESLIAGIGVVILFWSIMKLFGNMEDSFNYIWKHKKPRRLMRKATDYLFMMIVCPIFIVISSSINMFIIQQSNLIAEHSRLANMTIGPILSILLSSMPYLIIWILFTIIYLFIPNLKIKISSGIIAGFIAGTIYQLTQWTYIHFQIGVSTANAIYGSFAALPLFLFWLQTSWLILLLGAEISFAIQNIDTYGFEKEYNNASEQFKTILSLGIIQILVDNFYSNKQPLSNKDLADILKTPIPLINKSLENLINADLILPINKNSHTTSYIPAHNINTLTIAHVFDKLNRLGCNNIPLQRSDRLQILDRNLKLMIKSLYKQEFNLKLYK